MEPTAPTPRELPTLPAEAPEPGPFQDTLPWWRAAARHFESRAQRAEVVQAFAVNVADDERTAREVNADTARTCAGILQAREAPVG